MKVNLNEEGILEENDPKTEKENNTEVKCFIIFYFTFIFIYLF